jgi:hypothetical protein
MLDERRASESCAVHNDMYQQTNTTRTTRVNDTNKHTHTNDKWHHKHRTFSNILHFLQAQGCIDLRDDVVLLLDLALQLVKG